MEIEKILYGIQNQSSLALAKGISLVENDLKAAILLLSKLNFNKKAPIIGITGAPGSGKSTLVNALASYWLSQNKKIAILAVDPSSPFNMGSILGDRLRMSRIFMHPNVFIRSISSRGSLGGLSRTTIEIADLLATSWFDLVLIETVGVGQSEVEICGLADTTVVVAVPEGGDDIQAMKNGIMEIANVFVVNKMDRPSAQTMFNYLEEMVHQRFYEKQIPVFGTIASESKGIEELANYIQNKTIHTNPNAGLLYAKRAYELIVAHKMQHIQLPLLNKELQIEKNKNNFNMYIWLSKFLNNEQ